jgi:hypothetical protein
MLFAVEKAKQEQYRNIPWMVNIWVLLPIQLIYILISQSCYLNALAVLSLVLTNKIPVTD